MTGVGVLILCFAAFRIAGGVRIKECSNSHWVEIRENDNPQTIITCDGFSPSSTVTWTLFSDGNQQANYTCGSSDQLCIKLGGDVVVLRANNGTESHSELVIYRNHRTLAGNGRIRCHEQGKGETASCNTNVIHPADVSDCEVNLNDTDRAASGSCQYQKAFSSNGTYTCTWYRQYPGQSSRNYVTTGVLTKTEQTTEGQLYYSGVCRLPPSPVPQTQGRYSYSVDLLPGPVNLHVGNITIQVPGDPVTNCPESVQEGQGVQCDCLVNPSSPGRPLPVVHWQGLQPGQPLVIENTTRDDIGTVFSCQLSWGPPHNRVNKTANYTLNVTTKKSGFPIEAVIVLVIGAIVVIAIIIVIVVVIKRKRRQKPRNPAEATSPTPTPPTAPGTEDKREQDGPSMQSPAPSEGGTQNASTDEYSTLNFNPSPERSAGDPLYDHATGRDPKHTN
ncbi:uncharacterized protein LOC143293178 [Babylonia areolata]|uniref:uncharacterized protein LOC143293178 n=1 Tax=Babylonia areolata TaxID=304850 RepID=UPI003FCFF145